MSLGLVHAGEGVGLMELNSCPYCLWGGHQETDPGSSQLCRLEWWQTTSRSWNKSSSGWVWGKTFSPWGQWDLWSSCHPLQSPALKGFKTQLDEVLSNLLWSHCWPYSNRGFSGCLANSVALCSYENSRFAPQVFLPWLSQASQSFQKSFINIIIDSCWFSYDPEVLLPRLSNAKEIISYLVRVSHTPCRDKVSRYKFSVNMPAGIIKERNKWALKWDKKKGKFSYNNVQSRLIKAQKLQQPQYHE